jgi:hypothetical protein
MVRPPTGSFDMPRLPSTLPLALLVATSSLSAQTRAPTACVSAPVIQEGAPVRGTTAGADDLFHASCARSALSGDRVFRLQVPRRSRVSLRLESDYDAALYVRRACDEEITEVACNDDARDTRHAALDLTLDAGAWFVFVDGFDVDEAGQFSLSVTLDSLAPPVRVEGVTAAGGRHGLAGTPVEALNRAGRVLARASVSADGHFGLRVPGEQLVRVRARVDGVELSTEFFDPAQRPSVTLGGASVRRAPAGGVPNG